MCRTIDSVKSQNYRKYEYLIIDGASNDGSRNVIRENEKWITSWVSEPDFEIYCAMNKGIDKAQGDYCLFLNSGDLFANESMVERIERELASGKDIYYSDAISITGNKKKRIIYPRELYLDFFFNGTLNHQNTIIRRQLLVEQDKYREDMRIGADWFFLFKVFLEKKATFQYMDVPISEYMQDGISSSARGLAINKGDRSKGISDLFGDVAPLLLELCQYRDSIYGNTIRLFGYSHTYDFLLKLYRFFIRRVFVIKALWRK